MKDATILVTLGQAVEVRFTGSTKNTKRLISAYVNVRVGPQLLKA
jgi:hypothetical protein